MITPIKSAEQMQQERENRPPQMQSYTPVYTPFEYQEGMYASDIINQKRQYQASLEEEQKRAQRMAKLSAFTDFFKALGGLAGGGYATTQQYQPSPYLTKAFGEIDRIRSDKNRSDMYYSELLDKTRQQDYNTQLKYHQDTDDANNKYNLDATNRANDYEMKVWQQTGNLQGRDRTLQQSQNQFDQNIGLKKEDQTIKQGQFKVTSGIQQQNANANTERANKVGEQAKTNAEQKAGHVVATIKKADGSQFTISVEQARVLVAQARKDYANEIKTGMSTSAAEQDIIDAVIAAKDNESLGRAAALLSRNSRYEKFFRNSQPVQAATSFLPPPSKVSTQTTQKKPSLLP